MAREIATLVPPAAAASAAELVTLTDELAAEAAGRCLELHGPAPAGTACRPCGRPVREHVVDRQLTTTAVWNQEARLLAWAGAAVGPDVPVPQDSYGQAGVARAVGGERRLVLVVGPAGAGKTTALGPGSPAAGRSGPPGARPGPPRARRPTCWRARRAGPPPRWPSCSTSMPRRGGPAPSWRLPAGTTVVLDEAAMASTDDLDALVAVVEHHCWRLVCVGDPAQLPAVRRGGMFELWCERLPEHQLEEVRRFADAWQAEGSLALRSGDPGAAAAYGAHHRLRTVHPVLVAD